MTTWNSTPHLKIKYQADTCIHLLHFNFEHLLAATRLSTPTLLPPLIQGGHSWRLWRRYSRRSPTSDWSVRATYLRRSNNQQPPSLPLALSSYSIFLMNFDNFMMKVWKSSLTEGDEIHLRSGMASWLYIDNRDPDNTTVLQIDTNSETFILAKEPLN